MTRAGYTKTWRKELESDVWKMPPLYHRVWHFLLQSVSWEKNVFPTKNLYGIHLNQGQGLFSIQQIVDGVSWVERNVRKSPNKKTVLDILKWLEFHGMISRESNGNGTYISICNWDIYQEEKNIKVTQSIPQGIPQSIPQSVHTKEVKENKEGKEEKNTGSRATVFNPVLIRPSWISEEHWAALIDHRKRHPKKPVQSQTAYTALIKQFEKAYSAGWSFEECLEKITSRSWAGFEADWMGNKIDSWGDPIKRTISQKEKDAREILEGNFT